MGKDTESHIYGKRRPGRPTKVAKVMHEFKEGTLKSGSGATVEDYQQAVAIALSEARKGKK